MTLLQRLKSLLRLNVRQRTEVSTIYSHPPVMCTDLDGLLQTEGERVFQVAETPITLHLDNIHERRYTACLSAPMRYPQYDIDKMLIERYVRTGDVVLDAGANIGLIALHFIERGAERVVAVEAIPALAERIRALHPRVTCVEAALSNHGGQVELLVSQTHNQGSTYDKSVIERFATIYGDTPVTISAAAVTIDTLPENAFDIWKLDIEGAEVDALQGATDTLRHAPPV